MKILFLGLVLTLSTTTLFAKCVHNLKGEFTSFNGSPLTVGSKIITVARESDKENILTIQGLDGITHVYGDVILIEFIDNEYNRVQVSCSELNK